LVRVRTILATFAVIAVLAGVGVYLFVHSIGGSLPIPLVEQSCTVTAGGRVTLDTDQMANAATISAVGIRRGLPTRAVQVALATALQESKLHNLDGGDRDSIGLFQQRPSQGWGTPDQIADPRYAAGRFYTALLRVRGWSGRTIADAAQAVQHSADGSAYERWADEAGILADAFAGDTPGAVACIITDAPAQRGPAAATALAAVVQLDWGPVPALADAAGLLGVDLTVSGSQAVSVSQTGWRYAHWLVAHSADSGIKTVRFGGQLWSAKSGDWTTATADPATVPADHVIAEVYAA
jgi:hypothetical protein